MSKQGLKKNKQNRNAYLAKKKQEKDLWTMRVIAYQQQAVLDTVSIALSEEFGFGPERQHRFQECFEKLYPQILELQNSDTEDGDYSRTKIDERLHKACGEYFEPWRERYDVEIVDSNGNVYKLLEDTRS